jgi:hypothetical protein
MHVLLLLTTLLAACALETPTLPEPDVESSYAAGEAGGAPEGALASRGEVPVAAIRSGVVLTAAYDRLVSEGVQLITVTATLTSNGIPVTGAAMTVTTPDGVYSTVTELGGGRYLAYALPFQPSGHVQLVISGGGKVLRHTGLVLPLLGDSWTLAEPVPGLVNTTGYEDSAEISPDGEWLLVADYSPVDLVCCVTGSCGATPGTQLDPAAPVCNTSIGPLAAPARPRLPGLERVLSPTVIHDEVPSIGYDLPLGTDLPVALPPLTGYGFKRQADGSFAQPFLLGFKVDGASTPFGYTFAGPVTGTAATLVFAYDDLRNVRGDYGPPMGPDLFRNAVTLGVDNNFGTFSVDALGRPVTDRFPAAIPLPSRAGQQGNPAVSSDGVWFDTESEAEDLFFAAGNALGASTLAAPVKVALSRSDRHETQPYLHQGRLYFSAEQSVILSSARAPGGDPAQAATWGPERLELGAESGSRVGAVIAIGEPSLAVRGGVTSLYFVYALKTATGLDLNIGRVTARTP